MKIKLAFSFEVKVVRDPAPEPDKPEQFEHRETHSETQLADPHIVGFSWEPRPDDPDEVTGSHPQ